LATLNLYTYFRSSCAYRVRIALNLKSLTYEPKLVHLLRGGGEQRGEDYLRLNPEGLVPTLVDRDVVLTQSSNIWRRNTPAPLYCQSDPRIGPTCVDWHRLLPATYNR
jgi:Glutathione S-transferase, N-terminal domain